MNQPAESLLERAKLALRILFKGTSAPPPAPPPMDPQLKNAVVDVLSQMRQPGFPCPECGENLVVDITTLLTQASITCPKCGLELKMNWDEDSRARQALENVQTAAEEVKKSRKFGG